MPCLKRSRLPIRLGSPVQHGGNRMRIEGVVEGGGYMRIRELQAWAETLKTPDAGHLPVN